MESFDRSLSTCIGFLKKRLPEHKSTRNSKTAHLHDALEHVAKILLVLKTVSRLCTHLNKSHGKGDSGACGFYSEERDSGLNDDTLFSQLPREYAEDGSAPAWASVPVRLYWNVFLGLLLKAAASSSKAWHEVASRLQFLAIKPMAACIEKHIELHFCDSIAAKAALQHLKALTGPAENSSMRELKKKDYQTLPFLANDADVRRITENESMVYDAILLHQRFFAGPVEDMAPAARIVFCGTMKNIATSWGKDIAAVLQGALKHAGDVGRREMVPVRCNPCREDYVHDESMFSYVVRVLADMRSFIELQPHSHWHS